jgi:hypothetical protein
MMATHADEDVKTGKRHPGAKINQIFSDNAVQLYDNDYIPLPLTDKEPLIRGWQRLFCNTSRPSLELIKSDHALAYRGGIERNGIGVACYNGLTVVDLDSADPASLERLLSPTPLRASSGRSPCRLLLASHDHWDAQNGKPRGSGHARSRFR